MANRTGAYDESDLQHGGEIPGMPDEAAFAFSAERSALPVLLSVPHGGRSYPPTLLARMRDPAAASLRLEDRYVDLVARAVAARTGAALLLARAPRAMIDLNRAADDVDWGMVIGGAPPDAPGYSAGRRARSGLGLVPRRLPGMGEIWKRALPRQDIVDRVERIHGPYHVQLAEMLEQVRDQWGAALLIDIHSMPPLAPDGIGASAQFVVGDRFGTSCGGWLSAIALEQFGAAGRLAAHNRPYAGGYVLDRHGSPARGLHALQLEICRTTYLDSHLREPGAGLDGLVEMLSKVVRRLADGVASQGLAQAAE